MSTKAVKAKAMNFSGMIRLSALSLVSSVIFSAHLSSPAAAENVENFDYVRPKTSLMSLFEEWQSENPPPTTIQPANAPPAIKPLTITDKKSKTGATTIKPVSSEEISDAEILAQDRTAMNDPLEPINRVIFEVNEALDFAIFTPISNAYRFIVPSPVRTGVANVVSNAKAPVTVVNDLLQGNPDQAQKTVVRFLINTTAGFGGFVDAAQAGGLPKHQEDFGQTLAVWGVGAGPYIVVPVLGPMTPRHLVGRVADTAATPTTWLLADFGLLERSTPTIAQLITTHEGIMDDANALRSTSSDFYASVRGIYRQSRKTAISNGKIDDDDPLPEIPDE